MSTKLTVTKLADLLNAKTEQYNRPGFIKNDPIFIPHCFTKKQDIEITGFFAAIFSWGNRTTIIQKSKELMRLMGDEPHDFCLHHSAKELKTLTDFKHRTFNATDLLYFIEFFKFHYSKNKSLETAFTSHPPPLSFPSASPGGKESKTLMMEKILIGFHDYFFSLPDAPARTKKHITTPERRSACKRLNMFLRWMVRKDNKGVDFGIWKNISPSQLICPIDLHVARVARRLNILGRKQTDWLAAVELTDYLRTLDKADPVKYDFALFGMGAIEKI